MTSFAVAIEPRAAPRVAAVATLVHLAAAAAPWIARVPAAVAASLSLLAVAGLASTLARVPGRHAPLASLVIDGRGCRVRLAGSRAYRAAELAAGARAYPDLLFLDVRANGRRFGWLLPRGSVPPAAFRRLKARIRLSC
jgi:hypothetical protein